MSPWEERDEADLTAGQQRRLAAFHKVEEGVCQRIEALCEGRRVEVTDVGVLVIAPEAHDLFFGPEVAATVSVVLGHRLRLYEFLRASLPPLEDAPFDPYADLLEESPLRCVRVLILDDESLTVMSYGTFVTMPVDPRRRAVA